MTSYGSIDSSNVASNGNKNNNQASDETKPLNGTPVSGFKPEEKKAFWSRLTFQWFAAILHIGNRNNRLNQEDLDLLPLPEDLQTEEIVAAFDKHWQEELQKEHPSLVKALIKAFGFDYFLAALLKFVHDLNLFVGPQVLHAIIVFLREPQAPLWHGLVLTVIITVSQVAMSLCLRHYFFKVRNAATKFPFV